MSDNPAPTGSAAIRARIDELQAKIDALNDERDLLNRTPDDSALGRFKGHRLKEIEEAKNWYQGELDRDRDFLVNLHHYANPGLTHLQEEAAAAAASAESAAHPPQTTPHSPAPDPMVDEWLKAHPLSATGQSPQTAEAPSAQTAPSAPTAPPGATPASPSATGTGLQGIQVPPSMQRDMVDDWLKANSPDQGLTKADEAAAAFAASGGWAGVTEDLLGYLQDAERENAQSAPPTGQYLHQTEAPQTPTGPRPYTPEELGLVSPGPGTNTGAPPTGEKPKTTAQQFAEVNQAFTGANITQMPSYTSPANPPVEIQVTVPSQPLSDQAPTPAPAAGAGLNRIRIGIAAAGIIGILAIAAGGYALTHQNQPASATGHPGAANTASWSGVPMVSGTNGTYAATGTTSSGTTTYSVEMSWANYQGGYLATVRMVGTKATYFDQYWITDGAVYKNIGGYTSGSTVEVVHVQGGPGELLIPRAAIKQQAQANWSGTYGNGTETRAQSEVVQVVGTVTVTVGSDKQSAAKVERTITDNRNYSAYGTQNRTTHEIALYQIKPFALLSISDYTTYSDGTNSSSQFNLQDLSPADRLPPLTN